jgi:hypothetical protein
LSPCGSPVARARRLDDDRLGDRREPSDRARDVDEPERGVVLLSRARVGMAHRTGGDLNGHASTREIRPESRAERVEIGDPPVVVTLRNARTREVTELRATVHGGWKDPSRRERGGREERTRVPKLADKLFVHREHVEPSRLSVSDRDRPVLEVDVAPSHAPELAAP